MIACNSTGCKEIPTYSFECRIISIFDDSSPFHPDVGSFEVNLFLIHTKLRLLQQNDSIWMYFILMLKPCMYKRPLERTCGKPSLWISGKVSCKSNSFKLISLYDFISNWLRVTFNDIFHEYLYNQIMIYVPKLLMNRSSKEECNRNTKMGITRRSNTFRIVFIE